MEEELNLRDVLDIVRRRRRLILTFLISGMTAALLFLMIVTPRYTAQATLKFDPRQFQIAAENKNVGPELFERLVAGEIAVMRSPGVVDAVIAELKLTQDSEFTGASWRDLLRSLVTSPPQSLGEPVRLAERARERFLDRLTVEQPPRSNLISIGFTSEDPGKAERIANTITTMYLARHLDNQLGSSPLANRWLSDRKAKLVEQWRTSERAVEDYKTRNNLSFAGGENLKEQRITQLNEQLSEASSDVEEIRANVEQVRRLIDAKDYTQLANAVQSDVMTRLREHQATTAQRQASMATALKGNHPQLKQINSEMASLRANIASEGRRNLSNLEIEFQAKQDRVKLIEANLAKLITTQRQTSESAVRLRELERTAESDKAIYEAFLDRSNETLEQSSGDFANFQLITKAQVPVRPSFPSKIKVLLLALAGSLMAGAGCAFLLETLFDKFRTKAHVMAYLKLPHLASMPELKGADLWTSEMARRPERLIAFNPQSAFAQATSALRVALGLQALKTPFKTLAVCSAGAGEGKTMVASAIAQHAALQGQKALLIDCDFRAPAMESLFQPYLSGEPIDLSQTPRHTASPLLHDAQTGLDIMPALCGPANAATYLGGPEFADLLATAKKSYDLVVLDTSALSSAPESWVVAGKADAALLVVEWDKTRREAAIEAVRQLDVANAKPIGVVLNRADVVTLAEESEFLPLGRLPAPAFGRARSDLPTPAPAQPFSHGLFGGAGE